MSVSPGSPGCAACSILDVLHVGHLIVSRVLPCTLQYSARHRKWNTCPQINACPRSCSSFCSPSMQITQVTSVMLAKITASARPGNRHAPPTDSQVICAHNNGHSHKLIAVASQHIMLRFDDRSLTAQLKSSLVSCCQKWLHNCGCWHAHG